MDWHLSLLFAILTNFAAVTLLKRFAKPFNVSYFTWITFFGSFLVILLFTIFMHIPIHPENGYILLMGIVLAIVNIVYNESFEIDMEHTVTVYEIAPFLTITLAIIFLKEFHYLDPGTFAGIRIIMALLLAFFSIFFLSQKKFTFDKMFGVAILSGTYVLLLKVLAGSVSSFEILFYVYAGGLVVLTPYILSYKRKEMYAPITSEALITGGLYAISNLFYIMALSRTIAIIALPIFAIGTTLLPLLEAILFFRKSGQVTRDQIFGILLGVVAIICLL